ncbi:MAG: Flp pilus assembly complex ATPase component TadA [Desulfobacterales bacterium]|uniref:Flp pilus assembly complex ATPase component TadA n=1 Tax=Candidatus Desulfatibia profunda TaxID=2841695 RepID=A0A8J6TKT6_9BACT|nr:Flp pilus assembly complex ATPase component TadA [Candidatus Desulfatibia profunda]MBL7181179.1 Flp pilus assembly complex ATPase component TadA [Desulfobacterales bacterium]
MKRNFMPTKRKKLGEILVRQGRITPDELVELLRLQKEVSKPLGQLLVDKNILSQQELTNVLGEQLGIPHVWLRKGLVDPRIVHVLPKDKALLYQAIPMFRVNNILTLATADPNDIFVFDEISKMTSLEVQPVICRVDDILEAINQSYQEDVSIEDIMTSIEDSDIEVVEAMADREISEIAEMAEGSPVINMTNMILLKAIRDGASDIHLEPQQGKFRVRARVDGVLYELISPKMEMHPAVVSRLKVMANLDIAERRMPQDGRIQVNVDRRTVDLRFSSMPGIYGEKVVLRILDRGKAILDINKLGFDTVLLERFKSLLKSSYGLILVCGPTGSGKTTTLYASISMLNSLEKNIITIEDPVEYQLMNINQNQVKSAIGLTFARFLKHALRQDPDIILVGEIRDRETAEIAIQASLTGHLVLSTLHTNDSPSVITRLLEMGIEPYLISSALLASMAQRLVRTICPQCKTNFYPSKEVLKELRLDETKQVRLAKGKGCADCFDSGFKGRIGIYELLQMDDGLQNLILSNPTIDVLQKHMKEKGHRTLREYGYEKVAEGLTTIEEVQRVTSVEA